MENRAVRKGAFYIKGTLLGLIGIILVLSGLCFAMVKDLNNLYVVIAFILLFFGSVICSFIIIDVLTDR